MATGAIPFRKMSGLGNAFLVFDARSAPVNLPGDAITRLGQQTAIGFDQMITIERSKRGADVFMRVHNRDGGEVESCGNASRCVGRLMMGESGRDSATIDTRGGLLTAYETAEPELITVDMGAPRFNWDEIPLAEPFRDTRAVELQIGPIDDPILHSPSVVNMGNPHAVFWVDDVAAHDLQRFGPMLEHHPIFPERANISLAQVTARDAVIVRTWERGVGITQACGTAACAAVVSGVRKNLLDRKVIVTLPGGPLTVEWRSDGHVWMTGSVATEFEGTLDPETLQWRKATERGAA